MRTTTVEDAGENRISVYTNCAGPTGDDGTSVDTNGADPAD